MGTGALGEVEIRGKKHGKDARGDLETEHRILGEIRKAVGKSVSCVLARVSAER